MARISFLRARIVTHASDKVASVAFCAVPEATVGTSASTGGFSNGTGLIKFLVYANIALRQTRPLFLSASSSRYLPGYGKAHGGSAIIQSKIFSFCISLR